MKDNKEFKFKMDRRSFLSRSACASMGLGSIVNTLAHLQLIDRAVANGINIGTDYKALICIFLRGGCDKNYFFRPIGTHPQKAQYDSSRGIAKPDEADIVSAGTEILPANAAAGEQFGLHQNCTNMASMFNNGELAIIQNIGTLAEPTTLASYQSGNAILPVQLFSHSNQVQEWMATAAEKPFTSGWAGAISSLINDTSNPNGLASMLITAAGNNNWLVSPGGGPAQYSVTSSGALSLVGYNNNNEPAYFDAIDPNTGDYRNNAQGDRLKAFENIMNYTHDHTISEGYNEIVRRARDGEGLVGEALAHAQSLDGTGAGQVDFSGFPGTNLGGELGLIAQLIAGRRCLGNNRQIFFCDLGGFDNHAAINVNLPNLLTQVDDAVGHFNTVMKQLEAADTDFAYDDFTCFEMSDFNRTFTPNGTVVNSNGTDHAWGTHAWCFGGAVKNQHAGASNLYGYYPDINPNGTQSVSARGRFIPTTSVDQYGSVLAEWFGVAPGDLSAIFPNLPRFTAPSDPAANLNFLDLTS
ncbi:MAG: DUF1501 domain-containing protein [Verrucomicrobiota bacterium]